MSNDNSFANKAIDKFLLSKDASLSISLPSIKADNSKPKDKPADKKITAEKESKAESAYEDYLENWQQGDPIPLMPPGKEFILCRADLNPMAAKREAGYYDVPELTKKPYKKSSPEEQLIELKNLGPKLSSSLTSLLGRVAKSRGLWVDDKNKLRCPPGSPAANQFTDITGSNCFIPSPQTAAGSARRAVRRAVNGADILSSPLGGRTDTSFAGTEQRVQRYTTDDFGMVQAAMGVGGRIGMPNIPRGPVWNRGPAVRGAPRSAPNPNAFEKTWHNGAMEMRERGRIATTQADLLHRRFMGSSEPLGLTRQSRRLLRAMDRQVASPSNYLLPSGNPVGDILNKKNFLRAMTEIMPNVDPNEFDVAFESAIPAGLTLKERMEAQIVARTFFEGLIFEAIQNPQHFKWVTQFNTGQVKDDPSAAFEVKLQQFAPSPLSGGRRAGVAVTNLARSSGSGVGETGGLHVVMTYNPLMSYLYAKDFMKTKFSDGSGQSDSVQGKALYLAVHETGHLVDFSEKLKALGLDPTRLSRYGTSTTLVSTPSGPARQPNFYSNGWNIDWSMVSNPTGNASVQEMIDAATALQTTSYTGGRFGGRRIDLQDDLNKFHLGFSDAFTNNINTTAEEHKLMAMFAGGDYAASSPIEARAEFYVTNRLFGESTKFPDTVYPPLGPMKTSIAEMNLVEKFAQSEGRRRATQEAEDGLIPYSDVEMRTVALASDVLSELRDTSRNTYGIRAGGWNVSGLMSTPERNGRVSLHARRVQDLVAATEIQTQRRKRGTNIPSGVSGKMSTPEIRKPSRPREPDNGPYTGRFLEIFNGVKDFADFRDRYRKEDIIYFDYETTGFGADGNMPVQIGAVRMRGGQVVERFNVFVNPGIPLGEWAQKNLKDGSGNPLTDAWLAQQESLKGAHEKLIEFFGEDALIGGQYTPFDLEVFERVTKDLGISYKPGGVIDSKALADETLPRWTPDKPDGPTMVDPKTGDKKGSNSLGPLAEYLGVDLGDGWHTADADAEASALVTERMLDRAVANPDTTPKTILDPEEMPNIVERRRKKYAADMEQYERDKIDYEAAVSGKMSVPQFETANGSTYERQPDGRYKRRKDPVRSTTIDGPVDKIQKKTSAEDIAKDAESAEKLRTEQKRLESMSDGELDTLFSDGEYTYVVHFGAEEIAGGEMDPARSVGAGDSFDADTRGINKTYSDAFITQYNTEKATAEHVSSVVDTLKNEGQIDSPISGTVPGTALSPYDSIYSGYYMKKGARRDRFSQDRDRPWPDADDLTEMGMTREELIDSLEKNTVPVLEDRWRPKTETVKKLESNDGQFTSAFTVAGVVSGKDNPEAYGGRYSEGYDAATADRQDRINSFAQSPRMGIHILRVKMGEDATRLGFGNKTQREVHMLGKHKVVASMAAPTWGKRVDLEGRDFFKGWMADVVKKDKAAKAAEAAGKPADVVETTFDNTVFLTPDAKYAVQLAADKGRHIGSNGELMGLSYDDRNLNTANLLKLRRDGDTFDEAFEKAGGVISHYPISRSEIRESPQVGLNPFEWDNDGRRTHTGSPVSSVTRRPGNDVDQTPSAGSGVSGKMTNNATASKANTQSIFGKLKALKERIGYGTDFDEKVSKEKLDTRIEETAQSAKRQIDYYFKEDVVLPQEAIDYIKEVVAEGKFFTSEMTGRDAEAAFFPIQARLRESGVWAKGDPMPPSVALEISRQIHIARGDTEMVAKIDEFKTYLKTATPEQLSADMRKASEAYGKSIDTRVLVRTRSIGSFIKGNRTILTQHDKEEREAAGIESMNLIGDSITTSARRKVEANILGLPFEEGVEDSPEVRELRPTSGYVTTSKTALAREEKFKKTYGDDIELMYEGPAGAALEASQNRTQKYGDSHFVLRPEVAERTRVFDADTVDMSMKDNAPLQLSSLGEDGVFLGSFSPLGILYDYKTGDTYPTPSGAFEASSDNGISASYKEALVLGRFKPEEVQAIIATPKEFRKELGELSKDYNENNESSVSLLIDMAQSRDELMREHGIEVVPNIRGGVFKTDDVEMFNPAMTDVWFDKNFGDKGLSKEEIIPDKSTTPYEAWLRVMVKSEKLPAIFEYRGPSGKSEEEKDAWKRDALKEELARVGSVKNQTSGVSGKMSSPSMPIEEVLADPATAKELRERSSAVEALSNKERAERFTDPNDPDSIYVIHFGASQLEGGQIDPARSRGQVGPNVPAAGNTRLVNDQTARYMVGLRNTARRDVSILEEIKRQMETDKVVDFEAIARTDPKDSMRAGRAKILLGVKRTDRDYERSTFTPPYWNPENFDAQIASENRTLSRLDKVAEQLIADDYQYTSTYRASGLRDLRSSYGGRYAEGGSTEWGDNARRSTTTGIHIFKVKVGDNAIEENSVGETHLVGKHTPVASLVVRADDYDDNPANDTWKGWVDLAIQQDIDKNNGKTIRPLGVSGKMSALTPEQMTRRNESIKKSIEESGGSWGDFVPDSYRDGNAEINTASSNAGGEMKVLKAPSKQEAREENSKFARRIHESIQKQIRGEENELTNQFKGYELDFVQHLAGMTPEQFEQEVRDAAISFHAGIDPRPRVQVPHMELANILEYGYKTTHEVRSDHSAKGIRLPYEASIGIHPKTPANLRPASGYVVHKDWLEAELKAVAEEIELEKLEGASPELFKPKGRGKDIRRSGRGVVHVYGGVEVILRPEVAERTKYLEGDTLNTRGFPTPMTSNDIDSIQYALFQAAEQRDKVTELLYGHWKKDHGASRRHMQEMSPPGFGEPRLQSAKNSSPYMEALIAGSFDSGDIEEIVLENMDYIPWQWLDPDKPKPGRQQEVTGGWKNPAYTSAPQLDHLSDIKHLTEKMGFSPAEAKIAQEILRNNLTIENGKAGIFQTEQEFLALTSLQKKLQSRGIKLTVKNDRGLDIFDPKSLNDLGAATAEEAIVMNVESRLRKMVRNRIAEAGKKAQEQASSPEKVAV